MCVLAMCVSCRLHVPTGGGKDDGQMMTKKRDKDRKKYGT